MKFWWKGMLCSVALLALAGFSASAAEQSTPANVVNRLHEVLLSVMKDAEKLGYQGRYDLLAPVLDDTFDLRFMGRFALGGEWKHLSEADQTRWLDTFGLLIKASYAGRFKGYAGQHFETIGEEPAAQETVFVRTKLVQPEDEDVELVYRVKKASADWRVIDIYLNGTVSELALRRSEYASVLKRGGFEELIATLKQKVADLKAGKVD